MNETRFQELLEAYGGDPKRWPEGERADAEAFAASNPVLTADALADARALDALLATSQEGAPSEALRLRVLAAAPQAPARSGGLSAWLGGMGAARPALGVALAVMMSIGVLTGYQLGGRASHQDAAEALWAAAFSGADPGFSYEES